MVGMSADMEMETGASGGLLRSLSRKMFGGESFFHEYVQRRDRRR